jgi:hypothetical protein
MGRQSLPEPEDEDEESDEDEAESDDEPDDPDDEDVSDARAPSPDDEPEPFDSDEASPPFALADAFVPAPDPPRSFFAQPEPLKWMVGGANSLRIVPSLPHDGQNNGPGSLRPWRMSVRWSHAVQAYS